MGVGDGLICQTGYAAKTGCQFDFQQAIHKTLGPIEISVYFKAQHSPETGHLPFGEIVLRNTLRYRVEEVFLIQGGSGLVLSPEPGVVDAALLGVRDQGISGEGVLATITPSSSHVSIRAR